MAIVVLFYLAIHFNVAGMLVEYSLSEQLSEQLNTQVTIDGDVEVDWMNQVVLNKLTIYDQQGDTLIYARRAMVAYELMPLLSHHLVLNTCQLIDFDIRAYRASADSVANYQFMIDALSKKDPDSKPFIERLDLNAILLRKGNVSYDVMDRPKLQESPIDPNHISISQLSANVHIHDKQLTIKKFHCDEHDTHIKADRCELSLDLLERMKAKEGEELFLMSLNGLEFNSELINGKVNIKGNSDRFDIQLNQLSMPNGYPSLAEVSNIRTAIDLQVTQLHSPLDSLFLNAQIKSLSLRHDKYGRMQIIGNVSGMPCQAEIEGVLESEMGKASVSANIQKLQSELASQNNAFAIDVHGITNDFDLARVLPARYQLGHTALDINVKAELSDNQLDKLAWDGAIKRLDWKGHTYRDILLDGKNHGKRWMGNIELYDTLADVNAAYDIDLSYPQHHYIIDGNVSHMAPRALNLTDSQHLDSISVSGQIQADILASDWRNAEGIVKMRNLMLQKGDQQLELEPIDFEGTTDRGALTSQIVHLSYDKNRRTQEYHVEGRIPVNHDIFEMLQIPVSINRVGTFEGLFDAQDRIKSAHLELPSVDYEQEQTIAATLDIKSDADGTLSPLLDFDIQSGDNRLAGALKGKVKIAPFDILLEPATLILNKEELQLAAAHLTQSAEGGYVIDNFELSGGQQKLSALGRLGKDGGRDVTLNLENFELGQIFGSLTKGYLHFGGRATGSVQLSSKPEVRLTSDSLFIQNFSYIDTLLGNANLNIDYAIDQDLIDVKCDIQSLEDHVTHIDGNIFMGDIDSLDLRFDTDKLPLGFINYWTGSILQQFYGNISGPVRLSGNYDRLQLEGHPYVDGRFTHDMIGAHFHLTDTVHLDPGLIYFNHALVDDCHGHPLTIDAQVQHTYLHQFYYDVNINMPEANQGFLALDRQPAPGRIYWGQLYAQGQAHLKGGDGKHRFNLNVGTTDKSWFYLSPREQDINPDQSSYSMLTFRDKLELERMLSDTTEYNAQLTIIPEIDEDDRTDIQVDLQINATDQCEVTVQMDPLSDDKLIGHGNGSLSVRYDPRRDITLAGNYRITDGSYTMSMKGDLMSKVFQLQNTSYVRFDGVPSEAELNLDARYSIPSVNLTDLDANITTLSSLSRTTVPVDCNMNVTGQLAAPQVRFDLQVKNVSDEIDAYVHNVIGTQEMLNQEVIYLLVFSKFYTPQYAQSTQSHSGSELTSFASASITSQLNQLLSHVSNNFTMGTNFRSDKGDFSDMEMDLSLSTRLLGDRLLLNGNVGYRDPANRVGRGSNSFIGDFDIEFLINNSGTIRAKAYSHYNERDYSINNALTTQGIGFILRKDFHTLFELWPWDLKTRKDKTKSESEKDNNGEESK